MENEDGPRWEIRRWDGHPDLFVIDLRYEAAIVTNLWLFFRPDGEVRFNLTFNDTYPSQHLREEDFVSFALIDPDKCKTPQDIYQYVVENLAIINPEHVQMFLFVPDPVRRLRNDPQLFHDYNVFHTGDDFRAFWMNKWPLSQNAKYKSWYYTEKTKKTVWIPLHSDLDDDDDDDPPMKRRDEQLEDSNGSIGLRQSETTPSIVFAAFYKMGQTALRGLHRARRFRIGREDATKRAVTNLPEETQNEIRDLVANVVTTRRTSSARRGRARRHHHHNTRYSSLFSSVSSSSSSSSSTSSSSSSLSETSSSSSSALSASSVSVSVSATS